MLAGGKHRPAPAPLHPSVRHAPRREKGPAPCRWGPGLGQESGGFPLGAHLRAELLAGGLDGALARRVDLLEPLARRGDEHPAQPLRRHGGVHEQRDVLVERRGRGSTSTNSARSLMATAGAPTDENINTAHVTVPVSATCTSIMSSRTAPDSLTRRCSRLRRKRQKQDSEPGHVTPSRAMGPRSSRS